MGQGFKLPVLEKPFVFAKSRFLTSRTMEKGLEDEINEIMKRGYVPCGTVIQQDGYYYQGMVKPILECDYINE